ncbi:hypothetical protein ACJJTC_013648 [Scirpophaga incertulas]
MDESRNSPAAASVGSKRKLSTSGSSSDYARDGDHNNCASSCNDLPTQNSNIPIVNNGEFLNPPSCSVVENISDLSVTVKEPSITTALPDRVVKLTALQRFDSPNWNAVRYTETQKNYVASPGFIELKLNEELKRFDDPQGSSSWSKMERSFAALSNAVMAQNEIINAALQNLIDWSAKSNNQLSPNTIYSKLKELFGDNSDYKSASHDILQITCGKRAEVIESRRRNILKNIKVKYIRDDIGKIPPSCDYMFNPSALANYLQKIGGIDKVDKQTAPVQHTARTFSPHNKPFQQPRTANKTRRNERKESNRINNDEASSKRKGEAKNKNIRKSYKNNKP